MATAHKFRIALNEQEKHDEVDENSVEQDKVDKDSAQAKDKTNEGSTRKDPKEKNVEKSTIGNKYYYFQN